MLLLSSAAAHKASPSSFRQEGCGWAQFRISLQAWFNLTMLPFAGISSNRNLRRKLLAGAGWCGPAIVPAFSPLSAMAELYYIDQVRGMCDLDAARDKLVCWLENAVSIMYGRRHGASSLSRLEVAQVIPHEQHGGGGSLY